MTRSRHDTLVFFVAAQLLAAVVLVVSVEAEEVDHRAQYTECMNLVQSNPEKAFSKAIAWRDLGGGEAAEHCTATALIGLEIYEHGARRLEVLAETIRADAAMKAGILSQASQAWLLAGDAGRAEAVATTALNLMPGDAALFVDRAQAKAARQDYAGAVGDLDLALSIDATSADAHAFRGSANRFLGDFAEARADIERALTIEPRHLDALFERGILKRLAGDTAGARADWLSVLAIDPQSVAAEGARANLEKMDVAPD